MIAAKVIKKNLTKVCFFDTTLYATHSFIYAFNQSLIKKKKNVVTQ